MESAWTASCCGWSFHSGINQGPDYSQISVCAGGEHGGLILSAKNWGGIERCAVVIVWLKKPSLATYTHFWTRRVRLGVLPLVSSVICCKPTTIKTCTSAALVLWILFVSAAMRHLPCVFRCQNTLASDEPLRKVVWCFRLFRGKTMCWL